MDIDIYDFDKTIVPFDSGSLFWGYCLLRYPWIILLAPLQAAAMVLSLLHIIDFTRSKNIFFLFVPLIPLERAVTGFWNRHEKQVRQWFLERERYTVVISASPDFLLKEIQKRLGFDRLICTRHNKKSGAVIGRNCRGEEKVRRFQDEVNNVRVVDVYSDSVRHDKPIFSLADGCCYQIVKGRKTPFHFNEKYQKERVDL